MVLHEPPADFDGSVNDYVLHRGSALWRVHHHAYPAWSFNPGPASTLYGGARFDATGADRYPFLYAGLTEETALAETLLRELSPDDRGWRTAPDSAASGRRMAALVLLADLRLGRLIDAADLAAIGQDAWLVTAPGHDYPQTRDWAHWLRRQAPWAQGLVWDSLRDRGSLAVVLFGDRLERDLGSGYETAVLREVPELAYRLDEKDGRDQANERLRKYRAAISPPLP